MDDGCDGGLRPKRQTWINSRLRGAGEPVRGVVLVIVLHDARWTRAVLEQRRASVTCDDTGLEIVDWRNVRLSIPWADVSRVAAVDYGGFCKPPRVVVYAEGNLAHEFSPWLVSPQTLLECLIERASLSKGARTWSRQFWSSPAEE